MAKNWIFALFTRRLHGKCDAHDTYVQVVLPSEINASSFVKFVIVKEKDIRNVKNVVRKEAF